MDLRFWRQARTLTIVASNHTGHERPVANGVILGAIVGPVGALCNVLDVWVSLRESAVHHTNAYTPTLESAGMQHTRIQPHPHPSILAALHLSPAEVPP
jgi:hypothetical protein